MRSTVDLSQFESFLKKELPILTPGRRLAREIISAWTSHQQSHQTAVFRVPVEPVDAWLERAWHVAVEDGKLPQRRLLSAEQQAVLWQEIVRKDIARSRDFTLTQPRATALRAKAAWDKLSMQGGLEIPQLWSHFQFEEDCVVFARWARQFQQRLEKISGITRYQAYQQLLELPEQSKQIALYGFPELSPVTRRALEHLGELIVIPPNTPANAKKAPTIQCFATREDELAAASAWAYEMSLTPGKRSAIVLIDLERDRAQLEYFLRAEFECLDAQYNDLPVNFSTGMALGSTPLFRDATLALEWEVRPLLRHEWLALMRSPFFPGLLVSQTHSEFKIIERLFQSGIAEISIEQTLHMLSRYAPDSALKAILLGIRSDKTHREKKSLHDWAGWIRNRLHLWGWPYREALDSIEYQQLDRLEASLDGLGALSTVLPPQAHEAALTLWRQSLGNTVFQPKTPYDSVQVMGPLEAIGLEFDGIWVCGAQQGSFPRTPRLDAFLPASLQKRLDFQELNTAHLLAHAQKLLEIWCQEIVETVVSYHELDRGLPRRPSCLIVPAEKVVENSWFPPTRWKAPRQVEALALDERVPTLSQQHTGGSGLIKDQAACGFKAFVKHRIKVSSLGAEAFGFTAIERGILLHEMMFHLWRELSSQSELRRIAPSALPERIEQAATSAFTKLEADAERRGFSVRTRVGESCWRLERQFCVEVVSVWMEQERERSIPFTAVSLEEEAVLNLNGLELTLRPDRIDRLEDGRGIVIDYKSSAPGKSRWIGPRPQEPQLPLYTFLDNTLKGIAFAPLTRDGHFVPLGENLGLTSGADKDLSKQTQGWAEDWDELVSKWSSDLSLLAQAFLDGVANVDPTPGACQHCELQSACRIGQLRRAAHVVLEDESSE